MAAGLTVRLVQIGNWFGPDGVGVAEIVAVLVGVGIVVGIEVGPAPIGVVGLGIEVGPVVGVGEAAPGVVAAVEQVALCVTVTAPGLVEARTFSVGLSLGASDST